MQKRLNPIVLGSKTILLERNGFYIILLSFYKHSGGHAYWLNFENVLLTMYQKKTCPHIFLPRKLK